LGLNHTYLINDDYLEMLIIYLENDDYLETII